MSMQSKRRLTRRGKSGGKRTADEIVQILWMVIDEAKMYLEDPMFTPEEKRRWAKTLADTIGVLNKFLASQGGKPLENEDLGTLLTKVPRRFHSTVKRRVNMWRKRRL